MKNENSRTIKQRWQALFNQLEIIDRRKPLICSEAELLAFEAQTGIILPFGYKEFRQVFSSGIFGDFVNVYRLRVELSEEMIGFLKQSLKRLKEWDKNLNLEPIEGLLNSALVFGGTDREECFIWDLRTYSETDQSYDIYLARIDHPHVYLVGRNFLEFVHDFCLGNKAFEVLPQEMWPRPQELELTFTR